jgi:hypothetical protein
VDTIARGPGGKFLAGQGSPNPGGISRSGHEVRTLAREHGVEAVQRLVELMRSDDGDLALRACIVLLDRGFGRPSIAITGEDGDAIQHRHEHGLSERASEIVAEIVAALTGDDAGPAPREQDLAALRAEQIAGRH